MKTNRDKNMAHDEAEAKRVRPKGPVYDYKPLEAVIRQWILASK